MTAATARATQRNFVSEKVNLKDSDKSNRIGMSAITTKLRLCDMPALTIDE
jgi:hypothetical protein